MYHDSRPIELPASVQRCPDCTATPLRLTDCGSSCPNHQDYTMDIVKFLASKYPNRTMGLIESTQDSVIRTFFGYGNNNCNAGFLPSMPAATFTSGLLDARTQIAGSTNFGSYLFPSTTHTTLGGAAFYTRTVNGTSLISWVTAAIGGSVTNVGP